MDASLRRRTANGRTQSTAQRSVFGNAGPTLTRTFSTCVPAGTSKTTNPVAVFPARSLIVAGKAAPAPTLVYAGSLL